jgi:hypothetical protein
MVLKNILAISLLSDCCASLMFDLIFGVLAPLSTIFQLYHGDQ